MDDGPKVYLPPQVHFINCKLLEKHPRIPESGDFFLLSSSFFPLAKAAAPRSFYDSRRSQRKVVAHKSQGL